MRSITPALTSALADRKLYARNFVTVWAKTTPNSTPTPYGFWDGLSDVVFQTHDALTGGTVNRTFRGFGQLLSISEVAGGSDTVIRQVSITLSAVADAFTVVRQHSLKQQRVDIHRGVFSLEGSALVAPLVTRFTGLIDEVEVTRGAVGITDSDAEGSEIAILANSITAELTRVNFLKRSDEHQRLVSSTDTGMQHAAVVGEWEIAWGEQNTNVPTEQDNSEEPESYDYDNDFAYRNL